MAQSSNVSAGGDILASQYNNLRADIFGAHHQDAEGTKIVNADINAAAAIAMSKLSLAITNSEVAAGAAISLDKTADSASRIALTNGAQTVAGAKTFSSFPITPSSAPTADYEVANKKFVTDAAPTLSRWVAYHDSFQKVDTTFYGIYTTGTASVAYANSYGLVVSVSASSSKAVCSKAYDTQPTFFDKKIMFSLYQAALSVSPSDTAEDKIHCVAGAVDDGAGNLDNNLKHLGFVAKVVGGAYKIYATNANGSAQTLTDITAYYSSVYPSPQSYANFTAIFTPGVDIKFYINGALVATHTTNLPSGALNSGNRFWQIRAKSTNAYTHVARIAGLSLMISN